MSRQRKRRGHFCWCCGRIRANERFSGRGHSGHLCKECSRLGKEELAYRQAARDIDRLVDWNGVVRRKQRKTFERFLSHPEERVRRYAKEVAARDLQAREAFRQERLAEEAEELARERGQDIEDDAGPHDIGLDLSDNLRDNSDGRRSGPRGTARQGP
jgi:hypothetical protein